VAGPQAMARPVAAAHPGSQQAPSADGLAPDELYMEADLLTRDDKRGVTTAEGNVEIRYQGRTLRADRVVYEEAAETTQGQQGSQAQSGQPAQPGVIRAFGH